MNRRVVISTLTNDYEQVEPHRYCTNKWTMMNIKSNATKNINNKIKSPNVNISNTCASAIYLVFGYT